MSAPRFGVVVVTLVCAGCATLVFPRAAGGSPVAFRQSNLVSDGAVDAPTVDDNLKNPWGLALSPTGVFWVSNQRTGTSTLYDASGNRVPPGSPLVVTVPAVRAAPAGPTGVVFNGTSFAVTEGSNTGPAAFIFSGLDGSLSGWAPTVATSHAITAHDDSARAIFTGLTMARAGGENRLYAANGRGSVDVYGPDFQQKTVGGSFADPDVPDNLVPFNVHAVGDELYVTYAIPGPEAREEPEGSGAVSVFDLDGNLLRHLVTGGRVASPWGMAIAPASYGDFADALLVGNFNAQGRINAFDRQTGEHLGTLVDAEGQPVGTEYLWSILPGNGAGGTDADTLYFTAGLDDETRGVFGKIELAQVIPLPNLVLISPAVLAMAGIAARRMRLGLIPKR
jgi:uncharacterized protein (TIGR03118 family)